MKYRELSASGKGNGSVNCHHYIFDKEGFGWDLDRTEVMLDVI
jgi:hypothetical protein